MESQHWTTIRSQLSGYHHKASGAIFANYAKSISFHQKGAMLVKGSANKSCLLNISRLDVDFAQSDSISNSYSSQEMKEMVWNAAKIITCPTLVDYFPILKAIDPQGVRRRAKVHYGKLFDIMDGVIRQRSQERDTSITYLRKSDFLETLLDVNQQNGPVWSYEDMKHLIMDLLLGGTETSSVSVEWTMAELLRNPENKTKARDEIRKVIGQNKLVKESDISNLPYLQSRH
nr:inactive cytochrome P450 76AD1-like [Coffea arabica]